MFLSIIIPTFNESLIIASTIKYLQQCLENKNYEIIISDAGSTDNTIKIAQDLGVKVLISQVKGRAGQMNFGLANAMGNVFFFLHSDSLPTKNFFNDIQEALDKNYNCGSFRTKFDKETTLLKINSFFTRFNFLFFRGGDQGIFITKELLQKVGNFKEDMLIMEDYDFIERLWNTGKFKLIPKSTLISARKYQQNYWLTVQLANLKIVTMYKNGASQIEMVTKYKELLTYRKNAF
ncbi:MAG: TIGR04283 family arsenosugar biosynthesis glycosyltransferase [Flavobacterium sp.]|nr:TIGR04283 family arsenosugar biosynthesis glycosyltransferase [Flavobacterium sp.]